MTQRLKGLRWRATYEGRILNRARKESLAAQGPAPSILSRRERGYTGKASWNFVPHLRAASAALRRERARLGFAEPELSEVDREYGI